MLTTEQEIQELETQLEGLKLLQNAAQGQLTPMQQLAEALHTLKCRWNHTDGCSWEYEYKGKAADWMRDVHKQYFMKALDLAKANPTVTVELLTQIIKTI